MKAILSIHDVMPETLESTRRLLQHSRHIPADKITLLVVPGKPWSEADLKQLQQWQAAGHPLAGHGWHHRCDPPKSLYHRLHSLLVSRRVAEHLSLSDEERDQLMTRCFHWFQQRQLTVSPLYVPPAWALGHWRQHNWLAVPFSLIESTCGLLFHTGKKRWLPLLGFEADTRLRAIFLRFFNGLNYWLAALSHAPLRIAIHPEDLELKLSDALLATLNTGYEWQNYQDISHPKA